MEKVKVKVKGHQGLVLPKYMTEQSAGFDLIARGLRKVYKGTKEVDISVFGRSIEEGYFILRSQERALVGTNLFIELPQGKQLEVRSRSGMATKRGIIVGNSPGTIDADYRGEIMVLIVNTTNFLARINFGDAIAQGVITDAYQVEWEVVEALTPTARGEGGFGSTSFWKPESSGEINVLKEDTFLSESDINAGTYLVTGGFPLGFPKAFTNISRVPFDGRRVNRVTIFEDKRVRIEYLKK